MSEAKKMINFNLIEVLLLESKLNRQKEQNNYSDFSYIINIEHKVNLKEEIIIIVCDVKVQNKKNKDFLGQIKTGLSFKIYGIKDHINEETKELEDSAATLLNGITISTSRGIMFMQFKGTHLHEAYLPIVDPTVNSPAR